MKAFAAYAAPFKQILMLDSDSLPVRNPAALFETAEWERHGALFFPVRVPAIRVAVYPVHRYDGQLHLLRRCMISGCPLP